MKFHCDQHSYQFCFFRKWLWFYYDYCYMIAFLPKFLFKFNKSNLTGVQIYFVTSPIYILMSEKLKKSWAINKVCCCVFLWNPNQVVNILSVLFCILQNEVVVQKTSSVNECVLFLKQENYQATISHNLFSYNLMILLRHMNTTII